MALHQLSGGLAFSAPAATYISRARAKTPAPLVSHFPAGDGSTLSSFRLLSLFREGCSELLEFLYQAAGSS
jgi:hypothetical protein